MSHRSEPLVEYQIEERLHDAVGDLYRRIGEAVKRVGEHLREDDEGKPLIENIRSLVDVVPRLNIFDDDICGRAGLEDVRLHDCRHSFTSRALALGETLPVIGKLLGHSDIETTARYAHLARDSIHEAAERIADSIATDVL